MEKIRLDIVALSHSVAQSNNYAIVLGEKDGTRRIPIVIGSSEAQSIAVAMERLMPTRPLTHDLFKNTLEKLDVSLKEIRINNLVNGVFYSLLICERNGQELEIDSRTSDALALAVRFRCPIYTYEEILEEAGVQMVEEDEQSEPKSKRDRTSSKRKKVDFEEQEVEVDGEEIGGDNDDLSYYSVKELNKLLEHSIEGEDYERAATIRDEIEKRKKAE